MLYNLALSHDTDEKKRKEDIGKSMYLVTSSNLCYTWGEMMQWTLITGARYGARQYDGQVLLLLFAS